MISHLPEGSFKDCPSNIACLNVSEQCKAIPLTGIHGDGTRYRKHNMETTQHETTAICFLQEKDLAMYTDLG